nr:hypothetical protein [uncultured Flavobacterium sp.]
MKSNHLNQSQELSSLSTNNNLLSNKLNDNNLYQLENIKSDINIDNKSIQLPLINTSNNQSSFINDVLIYNEVIEKEVLGITGITGCFDDNITTDYYAQFPLFFINRNIIKIPRKVEYVLRKYISKKLLKEIHSDIDVAVELCLLFTTQLTSTYFERIDEPEKKGWKSLRAEYLRDFLSIDPLTYKKVITALEQPTSKGIILECDYERIIGEKSYNYRFGEAYIGKGIISYQLKTNVAQSLLNKHFLRVSSKFETNPIVKNLIGFYGDVSLPTLDQIKKEGDRLIGTKYKTKKGKILKKLGNHSRAYFQNPQKYSFVEDSIEVFKYLTEDGLMFPEVGNDKSGGRIVDSFTLMPSWIRRMIKIKGKTNVEADYSCLHPNIAISLYGGSKEFITHGDLGLAMNTDVDIIKVEHLSFFNKKVWQMKKSPLYQYYEKYEPNMLKNIIAEKYSSEFKHNITSRRLFAKEVEIMTDVVEVLNKESIYVGYIYDALFCHPKDANMVKEVMDAIIQKHNVKTTAKLSIEKKYNPITVNLKDTNFDVGQMKAKQKEEVIELKKIDAGLISFNHLIKTEIQEKIKKGKVFNFVDVIIVFDDLDTIVERVIKVYDNIDSKFIYVTESFIKSA